ncbi:hypothetical protein CGCF415_v001410 [Colletotrichum fructicola]|uniref:C2H2-type domain-containing protein n=2 Tax=Colletotrichum gloeosporioides species complex TaxID=2707338 RepID=A0A7J6JP83_COLFN|nr:uncharacterized protein CGMCC3_g9388 [Colletotrichum fructicola]KAF4491542.1 hypothetical protein CGGC5_v000430 [Colletotrichum fructicola Nara gc5]KAE9574632.1 hypothetical protein CGMCC3_g9388 [Colletotrichum fructicola]KAF4432898.1 hypothetical protein CFRS1_v007820 [Colletotrichum fructicola]KAF4915417.1 hypothetical protein CGCF415_v001410 [Colletotrichum fructicola]KAF5513185.1 hypothetical protein CGCF413_v000407 [Colletotrichum fructicola]
MPANKAQEASTPIMAPPTAAKRTHAAISKSNPPTIDPPQQWAEASQPSIENFDCSKYDYMPDENGGFWKLQPDYVAEGLVQVIPRVHTGMSPIQKPQDFAFTCLYEKCTAKPFKRNLDLDKHYKQAHADSQTQPSPALSVKEITPALSTPKPSPKVITKATAGGKGGGNRNNSVAGASGKKSDEAYYCDYNACNRKDEPFSRKDRLRIHLTDVHKEDVNKKNGEITDDWLQVRKVNAAWWRCTKCLARIKVDPNGWECPQDGFKLEDKRRELREKMMASGT